MKAMRRFIFVLSVALAVSVHAAQFKIGAHNFTLPDGFEIELVASTNLVPRPIEADFDEQGRLYVTDSSGSNDKVEKQLAEKPHRVVRLEDTDGDGLFDKSIAFADKMMLPQGCMWLDGSLYVAAPPSIWKLTDTNSDGVADVRVEWFQGKTLTGCANDLHGPYAGPDGWIYWCKGAFAKQTYTLPNGKEFATRASHIFRARPDGTGVEPVMTGGMDNPVGLTFTPEGERILSGTFFQHPAGGKRDGLIHALYGGVYGKDHDVLHGHPRTGDLLPMMTHLGPAAPAGLMRYESEVFGKDFQNNLFTACFNLHKIARHILEPSGATYKTTDSDFLVSDNTDFHPTDVLEDADGSLIVVDTGGWYKLCCPTSQLQKPDVLGGIYRIRRKGAPKLDDPRGSRIAWSKLPPESLIEFLSPESSRPAVRTRAVQRLAALGEAAIPALTRAISNPTQSLHAVWALTQINGRAREAVRGASTNLMGIARIAGIHSASAWRDTNAYPEALAGLRSGSDHFARTAAEALGRMGDKRAVPELLQQTEASLDRVLEHAITYALIEIGDATGTAVGLKSENASTRRIALVALDQMQGGGLKPDQVMPLLSSTNASLKQTALWILGHRPDWTNELAKYFQQRLNAPEINSTELSDLEQLLPRFTHVAQIQNDVGTYAANDDQGDETRRRVRMACLRVMSKAGVKQIPNAWAFAVQRILAKGDAELARQAVATARSFPRDKIEETYRHSLMRVAHDERWDESVRLEALAALPGLEITNAFLFDSVLSAISPSSPVAVRATAATVLSRAKLNESQLSMVAENLKSVGPLELPRVLGAFNRATNENLGLALVASLEKGKALSSLRPETLKPHLTNFPATVQRKADALLATLNTDAPQQKKHVDEMLASAKNGDVRRGQAIFNSPKAACSACHAIGYLGGNVGPDLTRIGQIRNERDLLEAIVYPSASFVRSYEPMVVATKSGEEFSGVLRKDAADEVVLATGANTEQRLARADVTEMRPGNVSVMPSGLAEQLSKEEVADLLAFLKATRW